MGDYVAMLIDQCVSHGTIKLGWGHPSFLFHEHHHGRGLVSTTADSICPCKDGNLVLTGFEHR